MKKQRISANKIDLFSLNYKSSFLFSLAIIFVGLLFQFSFGNIKISILQWPINLFIVIILVVVIGFCSYFFRTKKIVKWLSSVPAAISSILLFASLSLLMGFIPQQSSDNLFLSQIGLFSIATSWPFIFSLFFFLITLGFATAKRIINFRKRRDLWFILNHLGLWISIVAISLGSGDIVHLRFFANKNNEVWYASDLSRHYHKLPFGVQLLDYQYKYYEPKITLINYERQTFVAEGLSKTLSPSVNSNSFLIIENWEINVKLYYPLAYNYDNIFYPKDSINAVPAVYIVVTNLKNRKIDEGWITCGNNFQRPIYLKLNDSLAVFMQKPQTKQISSVLKIIDKNINKKAFIEVNKPFSYKSWTLYQLSSEQTENQWSENSLIEMVRDPWQVFVYIGFFMIFLGMFYFFIGGKK